MIAQIPWVTTIQERIDRLAGAHDTDHISKDTIALTRRVLTIAGDLFLPEPSIVPTDTGSLVLVWTFPTVTAEWDIEAGLYESVYVSMFNNYDEHDEYIDTVEPTTESFTDVARWLTRHIFG